MASKTKSASPSKGASKGKPMPKMAVFTYDVPKENVKLYGKIRNAVDKVAARVNKSVLVTTMGQWEVIKKLLDVEQANGGVNYLFMGVHEYSEEEMAMRAKQALARDIDTIHKRLKAKVKELTDDGKAPHLNKSQATSYRKKYENLESALAIFKLTEDFEGSMNMLQESVRTQLHQAGVNEGGGRKRESSFEL